MPKVPSKRRARQSTSRHLENKEKHQNESEGQSRGNTRANLSTGISYRRHSWKASLGQKTSIGDYITCTETHLTPAEIAAVKAQALTIFKEENFKHITSGFDVNQPWPWKHFRYSSKDTEVTTNRILHFASIKPHRT